MSRCYLAEIELTGEKHDDAFMALAEAFPDLEDFEEMGDEWILQGLMNLSLRTEEAHWKMVEIAAVHGVTVITRWRDEDREWDDVFGEGE